MRTRTMLGALAALAVVAAACGGGSTTTGAPGTTTASGDKPTITIVQNGWSASAIEAAVASKLITDELGYPTEISEIDENLMFAGLADGSLDVVFELWPSGVTADEQAYLDDGTVVEMGELGAIGKIGWFVPQYVIDEHPELATWEGFQDPALAGLFATASTGEKGRFLGTDPSYSQYDEAIIANLGLPLQVEFSGSEPATVQELDSRVAAHEPIVMYWWTPTAAVAKYELVNVLLPEYTEECYTDPAQIDCDYPEDVLVKLAGAGLEDKAPDVWAFVQNFQFTTDDQLATLPSYEIDGQTADQVATTWIADNESVWSAWTS